MPTTRPAPRKATYPIPGSRADQILCFIKEHPGCTKNSIITGLKLNAGPVKKNVEILLTKERITDEMDNDGYHHYTAKAIL